MRLSEELIAAIDEAFVDAGDAEVHPDVTREMHRIWTRKEAQRRLAMTAGTDTLSAIPEPVTLTERLAMPRNPIRYRVEGLWGARHRVLLAAQQKAGKSTLTGNLIRSLVDGDPFLGRFTTAPVKRVVLIDNELDPDTLTEWLESQQIQNTDAVEVYSIREKVGTFNLLDDEHLAVWAERIRGADVLILDCLRPVLDALGLDENAETGQFLVAFDRLRGLSGVEDAVLVHHMGWNGDRARGGSNLPAWSDVNWKVSMEAPDDDRSTRYFSAFGRGVDVPEGNLVFDPESRRLTIGTESRAKRKEQVKENRRLAAEAKKDERFQERVELLRAVLAKAPGNRMSQRAIRELFKKHDLGIRNGDEKQYLDAAMQEDDE